MEASKQAEENALPRLDPGTLTKDNDLETMIESGSPLQSYITEAFKASAKSRENKEKKKGQTSDQSQIEYFTRFYGIVLQWMKALVTKAGIDFKPRSELGVMTQEAKITEAMMKDIDSGDGKGSMILVRMLYKTEGQTLVKVLREVRSALDLDNSFGVSLDIDDDTNTKEKRDLCEEQFLTRLRAWHGKGNPEYMPMSYTELKDLPVILVVVNKGKMGITYPKSLRYYDLRLRYSTVSGVTRSAMEQDFGRACRYVCPGDPPLPTLVVSKAAEQQLHDVRKLRHKTKNKATGVYKLAPDYPIYMRPSGKAKETPNSDSDLVPYQKWRACDKHWDFQNTETADNRYLLVGRPQIGKTGVFLHLALLLWELVGGPQFSSPASEQMPLVELEIPGEDEEEEEGVDGPPVALMNMWEYPDFNIMRGMKLERCQPSSRYGNPHDPEVQRHYLVEGKQYPFPGALQCGANSLMNRTGSLTIKPMANVTNAIETECRTTVAIIKERVRNKFCSKVSNVTSLK